MLTEPNYNSTLSRIEELRRRKHFNVVTYIPDISDKKLRYQTFLQNIAAVLYRQEAGKASEAPALPGPVLILLHVTRDGPVSA